MRLLMISPPIHLQLPTEYDKGDVYPTDDHPAPNDLRYQRDKPVDQGSSPLREHRNICEKCHRGPAHELLEAVMRKPKGRRKKKKMSDDEFDESEDEQQRLTALGGWVRWYVCSRQHFSWCNLPLSQSQMPCHRSLALFGKYAT
jgi:hypothetical protein